MRFLFMVALLVSTAARAVPVTCTFTDEEQAVFREVLDTFTGSPKALPGGLMNAQKGAYLENKFSGQLGLMRAPDGSLRNNNCMPVPPTPPAPPVVPKEAPKE